jgi:hypothetical protein
MSKALKITYESTWEKLKSVPTKVNVIPTPATLTTPYKYRKRERERECVCVHI